MKEKKKYNASSETQMRALRCHASIYTQRITRVQNLSPLSTASPMATGLRAVASFVLVFCYHERFENQN